MMFEVLYYASVVICFTTSAIVAISTLKFFIGNLKAKSDNNLEKSDKPGIN